MLHQRVLEGWSYHIRLLLEYGAPPTTGVQGSDKSFLVPHPFGKYAEGILSARVGHKDLASVSKKVLLVAQGNLLEAGRCCPLSWTAL